MAQPLHQLLRFAQVYRSFIITLESEPWNLLQGTGCTKRFIVVYEYRKTHTPHPSNLVALSYVIGQEWANQISETVRLNFISPDHETGIVTFTPQDNSRLWICPPNWRVPRSLNYWFTAPFLPANCPFCHSFEKATDIQFQRQATNGIRNYEAIRYQERIYWDLLIPSCDAHRNLAQDLTAASPLWKKFAASSTQQTQEV